MGIGSKLVEAHTNLATLRTQLEQSFLDNRTYVSATCTTASAVTLTVTGATYFTYTCQAATATTYTLTATGSSAQKLTGIAYTVDQSNTRATTITASSIMANAGYTAASCWVRAKYGKC